MRTAEAGGGVCSWCPISEERHLVCVAGIPVETIGSWECSVIIRLMRGDAKFYGGGWRAKRAEARRPLAMPAATGVAAAVEAAAAGAHAAVEAADGVVSAGGTEAGRGAESAGVVKATDGGEVVEAEAAMVEEVVVEE